MASTIRSRMGAESGRWLTDISHYPRRGSDYFLQMLQGNATVGVMPLPNGPAKFSITENFATSIDFTLGYWPKREHSEPRSWTITISGRAGTENREGIDTAAKETQRKEMTPLAILREFEEFIDDYQTRARDDGAIALRDEEYAFSQANHTMLKLHANNEEKHFFVELVRYQYDRDAATSRNSAEWLLVLEGWAPEGRHAVGQAWRRAHTLDAGLWGEKTFNDGEAGLDRPGEAEQRIAVLDAAAFGAGRIALQQKLLVEYTPADRAADALARVRVVPPGTGAHLLGLAKVLDDWKQRGATVLANGTQAYQQAQVEVVQYQRAVADLQRGANRIADLLRAPLSLLGSAVGAVNALLDVFRTFPVVAQEYDSFFHSDLADVLALCGAAAMDAATLYGYAGGTSEGLTTRPPSYPGAGWTSGVTPAVTGAGYVLPAGVTSWKELSAYLFGVPDFWLSLSLLNNAKDSYSDENGAPLGPGKIVQVPFGAVSPLTGKGISLDAVFGTDFAEGPDGDWVCEQPGTAVFAAGGSDVRTVSGVANLQQAILNRMTTQQQTLTSFPTYGMLNQSIGTATTEKQAAWAVLDVRQQMLQDPRIADITKVKVVFLDNAWHVQFTATPVGPQPKALTVLAPMASF